MLERDEGYEESVYLDSLGFQTIGIGHLVDRRKGGKLPRDIIYQLLARDISEKTEQLYSVFPWAAELDEPRRAVLICACFQLGIDGLAKFKKAMEFMRLDQYYAAASAFADSLVAREQAPKRWERFCNQLRSGEWQ